MLQKPLYRVSCFLELPAPCSNPSIQSHVYWNSLHPAATPLSSSMFLELPARTLQQSFYLVPCLQELPAPCSNPSTQSHVYCNSLHPAATLLSSPMFIGTPYALQQPPLPSPMFIGTPCTLQQPLYIVPCLLELPAPCSNPSIQSHVYWNSLHPAATPQSIPMFIGTPCLLQQPLAMHLF